MSRDDISLLQEKLEQVSAVLQKTEHRHRTLLEQLPVGVYRTTDRGRILEGNQALARILGYSFDELDQMAADDVFANPGEREKQLEQWRKNKGVVSNELQFRRGDGTLVWIRDTGRAVLRDDGSIIHLSGIIEDITERKLAEEALQEQQKAAVVQQRLAAVGQLAAGVAHDFNNVLCGVMANAQLLERSESLDDRERDRLKMILESCDNAATMIHQILDFSRQSQEQLMPMDLGQVVQSSVNILAVGLQERFSLALEIADGEHRINGEQAGLHQTLANLVMNARDAMGGAGTAKISVSGGTCDDLNRAPVSGMGPGDWVLLQVTDTGCGMPDDVLPNIFEPFFTTKDSRSTGLGLSQVYGIVQRHGGVISVSSKVGEGTVVSIYFPGVGVAGST